MKSVLALGLGLIAFITAPAAAETATVTSPDGRISLTISDEGGAATYQASYQGRPAIGASKLGLSFRDHHGFDKGLAITATARTSRDTTWEQPWGERRLVRDHHNELAVTFAARQGPARRVIIRFRVFDTGIGFRYEIPEQPAFTGPLALTEELTQFNVGEDTQGWWIPSRQFNRYEYLYRKGRAGEIEDAHTPITLRKADGLHMAIHEAALVDYSAMSLLALRPGTFEAQPRPGGDGIRVHGKTPFITPWRTIQIAPQATGLINSDIILNLNEPNALGDVSWVKPGKYLGVWWEMHIRDRTWGNDGIHGANNADVIRHIDFAAEHGFSGVLVEGWNTGWDGDWFNNGQVFSFTQSYPDFDLPMLSRYARSKGVSLIGHHETSGHVANYEAQLEAALDLYAQHGVTAVKTGYVADAGDIVRYDERGIERREWHDSQFMVGHHLKVVREAAKRRIAINAHEPVKDTGLRRTYPNWLTREGARGMEYNAWGWPPNPPAHEATLAFTRMLAGPMDFTPGIFDLHPNARPPLRPDMPRSDPAIRPQTTLMKQLALYVVLYSPLQMAADLPENYAARMDAFQFIKDVAADWEESIALQGEVGEFVVMARQARGSDAWFLGAVSDGAERELAVPLDFLADGVTYTAEIYADGVDAHWERNPYSFTIEKRSLRKGDTLPLWLAAGGGAAVRFVPER
jgi:alpha-glucosidase